jgi:hypothetical protein
MNVPYWPSKDVMLAKRWLDERKQPLNSKWNLLFPCASCSETVHCTLRYQGTDSYPSVHSFVRQFPRYDDAHDRCLTTVKNKMRDEIYASVAGRIERGTFIHCMIFDYYFIFWLCTSSDCFFRKRFSTDFAAVLWFSFFLCKPPFYLVSLPQKRIPDENFIYKMAFSFGNR